MTIPSGPESQAFAQAFAFLQNAHLGMDPRTTSVLESDHPDIFQMGLERVDAEMANLRAEGREQTVLALSRGVQRLDRPRKFNASAMQDGVIRAEIEALHPHRQTGVWISPLVRGVVLPAVIMGSVDAPESDLSRRISLAGKFGRELAEHQGLTDLPDEISTAEFATILRERGGAEHTLASFLHRSALATGAIAVSAAEAFVHDLNNVSSLVPNAALPTRRLFGSHRAHLLASSPVTHLEMAKSVAFLIEQSLALTGRSMRGSRRELMEGMIARQEAIAGDINRWEDFADKVMRARQEAEQSSREQITVTGSAESTLPSASAPVEAAADGEAEAARRTAAREFIEGLAIPELDAIILPSQHERRTPTVQDLQEALGDDEVRRVETHATDEHPVLWERLLDLAIIGELYGGELRRGRPETFNDKAPWYVVTFERDGIRYAVTTSPIYGRATYIVSETQATLAPLDVLQKKRGVARTMGAISVRHSVQNPSGDGRVELLMRRLDELHAQEPATVQNADERPDDVV